MKTLFLGILICSLPLANVNHAVAASKLSTTSIKQMPTAEEMAQRNTEWMKTELSLTAEQLTTVSTINLKYANKMKEIFESANGDFEGMRPKMESLQSDKRTEFAKILTAEQLTKYDAYVASHQRGGPRN